MKYIILIVFIIFINNLFGQQSEKWIKLLNNPRYEQDELKKKDLKENYIKYDFSTLLIPKTEFLGFIGSKYRRINIYFNSITKNETNPEKYDVKGVSLVGKNRCNFIGEIQISQVKEYKHLHFGVDSMYSDSGLVSQGALIGKYFFWEDSSQSHSGIFQGIMTLFWYLDDNDILHYDDIDQFSDKYQNNQYIGTWKEYNKTIFKICNWGEYRIPFSGDLDIGVGEFSANPKYKDQGWSNLIIH